MNMFNADIKLFEVNLPNREVKNEALVLNGCNAYIRDMKDTEQIYSELEELNYSYLNNNDYDYYNLEIEFCFENNLSKPYHWFYTGCFSIRTDNGLSIKLNGNPREKALSKINKNNKMVMGVGFYFRNEIEYQTICKSKIILLEGFFALDKPTNTFEVSCKLKKENDIWTIIYANSYQMNKRDDIRYKLH